jgi:NAD(P)-dependent dehydrogenase (short-subunit alcohol dehydrogenase family)
MGTETDNGRVVVVTGASDGIGTEVARALHSRGDRVVVVGRSSRKTEAVASELGAESHVADFASLAEVRVLAAELGRRHARVDVLINNAGLIAGSRRTLTADGHELSFQVNHLAPFLLTMLLRPQLSVGGGVVVTTSSQAGAAQDARVVLEDLDMSRGYGALRAYKASKLANVLFTRELARRWGPAGVSAAAVHPGMVRSGWGLNGPLAVRAVVRSPFRLAMRTPEQGARTIVWLATTRPGKDWESGGYFADCKPAKANPSAGDAVLASGLWERSESLCGL